MPSGAWIIDPWSFARTLSRRNGAIKVGGMPRLSESVASPDRVLDISVVGSVAEDGRSYVHVKVSGELGLTCQRCLESVDHVVGIDAQFQLWPTDLALPDDELQDDRFDALPIGHELDLVQLIEDEVLLGLPLSPRHADCTLPRPSDEIAAEKPFDGLKKLKDPH